MKGKTWVTTSQCLTLDPISELRISIKCKSRVTFASYLSSIDWDVATSWDFKKPTHYWVKMILVGCCQMLVKNKSFIALICSASSSHTFGSHSMLSALSLPHNFLVRMTTGCGGAKKQDAACVLVGSGLVLLCIHPEPCAVCSAWLEERYSI